MLIEHLAKQIRFFPGWEDDVNATARKVFELNIAGQADEPPAPN